MAKVYIASPYTKGDQALNVRKSLLVANILMDNGLTPYAPLLSHFQHMLFPRSYESWLEHDLEWIPSCDVLLRLPGESSGADKEVEFAKARGMPIYYNLGKLLKDLFDGKI